MKSIDLNSDLGEGYPDDEELLQLVSSCNIACGGHTGDADSMTATIRMALANGVTVGAHPSYPDRDGFGRVSGFMRGEALYESLTEKVAALEDIAAQLGAKIKHIKPHGTLYTDAVNDAELADYIARVTAEAPGAPALMGMANSELQAAAERHKLDFIAEGFIDRAYEPGSEPGAVHDELAVATTQAVRLAEDGEVTARNGEVIAVQVDTLCIHSDTPGAAEKARAVRDVLESHGVGIRAQTLRG